MGQRWVRRLLAFMGIALATQLAVRLYLFLRPIPTPPAAAGLLRSGWRQRYRVPLQTLAPLGLMPGMRVLEVGPGTGLFTCAAAEQIGPTGTLCSIDLQPAMLRQLRSCSGHLLPGWARLLAGDATALPLEDASVDAAFLIAVLPMIPCRSGALAELRRVLRPGARLLVSEELVAPEYVPAQVTERWLRQAGFKPLERLGGLWCYTIVAESRGEGVRG